MNPVVRHTTHALIVLVAAVVPAAQVAVVPAAVVATAPAAATTNVVAHQDDDLLFLNPAISGDIAAGRRVVTVRRSR